jgi:hypothetical protein
MNQIQKKPILKRYPPGDRWIPMEEKETNPLVVFDNLTDGLEWVYKTYDTKKFVVDAEDQVVYIIENEEKVKLPTENRYSIYGE